jgi:triphosphoribosyl-dephospho-CoA synthase
MQPEYAQLSDSTGAHSLRSRVAVVLGNLSVSDAEWAYQAICLAQPGGMGQSTEHDVAEPVSVTLLEAMRVARDRDRVAYQYVSNYDDIFNIGVPRFREAFLRYGSAEWATVAVYAELLSIIPDSLIERKYGNQFTRMVNNKMARLHDELLGTSRPEQLIDILMEADREFKGAGINPGTTADLTVASIFAERLGGLQPG